MNGLRGRPLVYWFLDIDKGRLFRLQATPPAYVFVKTTPHKSTAQDDGTGQIIGFYWVWDTGREGKKAEIRSQKPEVGGQGKKEGRMDEIERRTDGWLEDWMNEIKRDGCQRTEVSGLLD